MNKNEILKLLYKEKDYSKLKKICAKNNDNWHMNILAKVLFNEKKYSEAAKIYYKLKMPYETGYCLLLQGDLYNTKRFWEPLKDDSPIVNWGKALLGFIEKKPAELPSYFQIRNFLEQDLDALLNSNLTHYAENLVNAIDKLAEINSESYKFIARVLLNHGYLDIAKSFLEQSKEIYYGDPETHFLIAKIYIEKNCIPEAISSLKKTLEVKPEYFPAEKLLFKLK